jgi:hypothetical protein
MTAARRRAPRRFLLFVFVFVFVFLSASAAHACIVRHMRKDEALEHTDTTVIARVLQAKPARANRFSRDYVYTVEMIRSERGTFANHMHMDVEYVLDLEVEVKGSIRCPLQRGSGSEETLVLGKVYRMFIDSRARALFWSESIDDAKDG